MQSVSPILVWFRSDLRLHDHEPLCRAIAQTPHILPLYCFDPRQFGETSFGFPKTGAFRTQFLRESVADLRENLRQLGSDLIIRQGKPEEVILELVKAQGVASIFYHTEPMAEEQMVERAIARSIAPLGTKIRDFWGQTLHHPDALPFEVSALPEMFTKFRKKVERDPIVNPTLSLPRPPAALPPDLEPGILPTLQDLALEAPEFDKHSVLRFRGGETAGKARLQEYIWTGDRLRVYKETRNGMLGADYSSKFSPWLALGCLSPRYIYEQVQNYEDQRIANDSTYWLIFELLWRDYFRFVCTKHGSNVFQPEGLQGVPLPWKQDWERFDLWREGRTGFPLVDANMRELAASGFMSNRGRQNVASFLTKNLGIDWRMGAEWFESLLVDYDVCSNYGNWNYTAGVGNDARGFRFFNILKQSKDYDPQGTYVKHWLPELVDLPANKVHEPWKLQPVEQKRFSVQLGVDYPRPVVDLFKSAKANERLYDEAMQAHRR